MHTQRQYVTFAGECRADRGDIVRVVSQHVQDRPERFLLDLVEGFELHQRRTNPVARLSERARRVALVDGNQMFTRPGPRLIDAAEWLTGWLNDRPNIIPAGFPWEPF